jgi:hypothetical protein
LIFKQLGDGASAWHFIANKKLGERVTESRLRELLNLILAN